MAPAPRVTLKLRRDPAGSLRLTAPPDRAPHVARAGTALTELARRATAAGARPIDVQPVVEVRDAHEYAPWRAERRRRWRAEGRGFSTAAWPAELTPDLRAAVLLPLAHGAGAAARTVAEPLFSTRPHTDGSGPEDLALGLVAEWLRRMASGAPLRVAPPILDDGTQRRVLDFGLTWPLHASA